MAGVKGRSGGHNKKTRQALEQDGTFRSDRHGDHISPEPPTGIPVPPRPLPAEAQAEWDRMIVRLEQSKTLSVVDDGALYQYCQLFAETEAIAVTQEEVAAAARVMQENFDRQEGDDLTFEDLLNAAREIAKLRSLEASYITKVRQGRMALRMFLGEFGLTPASRGRVKLPDKPDEKADPFTAFQNQNRGAVGRVQ